jgi:hypothetical protein
VCSVRDRHRLPGTLRCWLRLAGERGKHTYDED